MSQYQDVILIWLALCLVLSRQVDGNIAIAWKDYENYMNSTLSSNVSNINKARGFLHEPILPDFSWAGYEYSNKPIPWIEGPIFNVVEDFGAKNDGSKYVDLEVTRAIKRAARNGGGVVYFPVGTYKFSPPGSNLGNDVLKIGSSNIVLRGAGAHEGGTIFYMDQARVNKALIKITGTIFHQQLTTIIDDVPVNSMQIKVANPRMMLNHPCFYINYNNPSYNKYVFGNAVLQPTWEYTIKNGAYIHEIHCVRNVDLKTGVVTMTEPMKQPLFKHENGFPVFGASPIHDVGIENIRFQSAWGKVEPSYCHHCSDLHDKGWNAIKTYGARNLWVRDCVFTDWSIAGMFDRTSAATVKDCNVTGKGGHFSFQSKRGYGNLFVGNRDLAGARHGPSVEASDVGTVYLRHTMLPGQSIDMHADNPRYTLLDSCVGGILRKNGGKVPLHPHHGGKLVVWNFQERDGEEIPKGYNFWTNETAVKRSPNSFFMPIIVGLRGHNGGVAKATCLHVEALNNVVEPQSLFDAQLALRKAIEQNQSIPIIVSTPTITNYDASESQKTAIFVSITVALILIIFFCIVIYLLLHRKRYCSYDNLRESLTAGATS